MPQSMDVLVNNTTTKPLNQSNMKQTTVEWLENEFQEMCKDFGGVHSDFIVKFEQAKEMEKEQIIEAYWNGTIDLEKNEALKIAEQYYNETFKSE